MLLSNAANKKLPCLGIQCSSVDKVCHNFGQPSSASYSKEKIIWTEQLEVVYAHAGQLLIECDV